MIVLINSNKFEKVAALEASASSGGIIAEMDVDNLTENLMTILLQLDEIVAEGDLKLQRKEQVTSIFLTPSSFFFFSPNKEFSYF